MILKLAARHALRGWHHIELRLLAITLFLAIFSQTLLLCLGQGLNFTFTQQAKELIGADLIIDAQDVISPRLKSQVAKQQLQIANVVDFLGMTEIKGSFQLTNIQAIDSMFPLRGKIEVTTLQGRILHGAPSKGEVWIDEALKNRQSTQIGDTVQIGNKKFVVSGIILSFPLASGQSLNLAPRLYMNYDDLIQTDLLAPGFRASYRLLLAGADSEINKILAQKNNYPAYNFITPEKGMSSLTEILNSTNKYAALIIIIQLLLAAVIVGLCTYQYCSRQIKTIALWHILGAQRRFIIQLYLLTLLLYVTAVLLLSLLLGYLAASLILYYQQGIQTLNFGLMPALMGLITGWGLVLLFATPFLRDLYRVTAFNALRFDVSQTKNLPFGIYIIGMVFLFSLFYFLNQHWLFSIRVAFVLLLALGIMSTFIDFALGQFKRIKKNGPLWWRFGISSFNRFKALSIVQVVVFTSVVMLMSLIQIIQTDFLRSFKTQLPQTTPNYFLINVQKKEIPSIQEWFVRHNIRDLQFYPIVRARLTSINKNAIDAYNYQNNVRHALNRPLNVTWSEILPADNEVISGISWAEFKQGLGQAWISIEQGFMERQKLKLGDNIKLQVSDLPFEGKIVQVRKLNWENFKPNFFIIFPPQTIEHFPHSYITSIYLPTDKSHILSELSRQFVELTIIDIASILDKASELINKVSYSIQGLLTIIFMLGVLIMYASIQHSLKERMRENILLKVFGADKRFLQKIWLVEFGMMALFASVFGVCLAQILATIFAHIYFDLSVTLSIKRILCSIGLSSVVIVFFGFTLVNKIFKRTVIDLMHQRV